MVPKKQRRRRRSTRKLPPKLPPKLPTLPPTLPPRPLPTKEKRKWNTKEWAKVNFAKYILWQYKENN
jgi:hypothetical protein